MKNTLLKLVTFALIVGSVLPAQAGIVQDTIEKAKDRARELLAVPTPVREKTRFEKGMDAIAGKYTRLKKCLKGEQACNKSDFAILGAAAIMAYSFTFGLRSALLKDLEAAADDNDLDKNGIRLLDFMRLTQNYDPLIMQPYEVGKKLFTTVFGDPNQPE